MHHRPGDASRLVRQRDRYDERRASPTQPYHPGIGVGRLGAQQIGARTVDQQAAQIPVTALGDTAQARFAAGVETRTY